MALTGFGQTEGSPFNFGNFFGSQGFEGLTKSLGTGVGIGTNLFSAFSNQDFMNKQLGIQKDQLGMTREAFERNKKREDDTANLDFTSGL
ncbi:MAG: hypothetical protein K0U20_09435 [Proteobacteria bacterium]|nr:hypothetical protein [Pseudomonadota bacterium]MCH9735803.1 hypothetical protein [Actinomycetes bacterium]